MKVLTTEPNTQFMAGGGEMGAFIRSKDWTKTPLGPFEEWPQSLRTSLSIVLHSKFPMFLWWGNELTCFYNDAYRPSLGKNGKHPGILGMSAKEAWPEIWDTIQPLLDQVLSGGESIWREDQLIAIYRNGKMEDVYWTYSYSPVNDETGKVAGVLVICSETTEKINSFKILEESNRRYFNHLMQAPVAMSILSGKDLVVEIANKLMLELWGKKPEEVINKPIFEGVPEAKGQGLEQLIDIVWETGEKVVAYERPVNIARNGKFETTYINLVYEALKSRDGSITGIIAIAYEVTSQVLARKKVEESGERFQAAISAVKGILWTNNAKGEMEGHQPEWESLTGQSYDEYQGYGWSGAVHPEDMQPSIDAWKKAVSDRTIFIYEHRLKLKSGKWGIFSIRSTPLLNADGSIREWVGVHTDITAQRLSEAAVKESEHRFRNVANSAPVLIWMSGTDKLRYFFNKAWLTFRGHTMEQESGNGWMEGMHMDDVKRCLQIYETSFDRREEFYMEYRLKRYDGEYRWISDKGIPRFTAAGIFEGYIGACMDIHERFVYHEKLKEDEEKLNIIIDASELGTWELNLITNELHTSKRYLEILGYDTTTKVANSVIQKKMHPDDLTIREQAFKKAYSSGYLSYESRIIWHDGSNHWIEKKGKVFYDDQKIPVKIIGTLRDITEEKNYREKLEEREQKFRLLADSMPQYIWTADHKGNFNYYNQSVFNYSGLRYEQIQKDGLLQIIHPDDRKESLRTWINSLQTGSDFLFEHRFRSHDGQYRWQLSRAIPQRDVTGKIQMWVGTSTDIEEQKSFTNQLEKKVEERTRQLEQKNRELEIMNSELQSFAYISSHDLQEPLRKIQTFSSRIEEKEAQNLSETGKDYFRRMQDAAKRMQTLIEDLLAYSRTNTTDRNFQITDLNKIVEEVEFELTEDIEQKHATIEATSLCEASIISFQFKQLVHNLIGNSIKFSKPGRPPHIVIKCEIVEGATLQLASVSPDKMYYHLTFSDNGIGFDPQYQERIFEVFQRLHGKMEFKGNGIGLAIVKKIVENHNGIITANSELDKGASFDIYFPQFHNG